MKRLKTKKKSFNMVSYFLFLHSFQSDFFIGVGDTHRFPWANVTGGRRRAENLTRVSLFSSFLLSHQVMKIVPDRDRENPSPGQTDHCSRFPDPKVSIYVPCFNCPSSFSRRLRYFVDFGSFFAQLSGALSIADA